MEREKRLLFKNQNYQFILLDLIALNWKVDIIQALKNVISMSTSMYGPSRIPMFGLGVVSHSKLEYLYPLQNVKLNPKVLHVLLETIINDNNIPKDVCNINLNALQVNILVSLKKIMGQFSSIVSTQSIHSTQNRQIEITIIAGDVTRCKSAAINFCRQNDVSNIKRLLIIHPNVLPSHMKSYMESIPYEYEFESVSPNEGIIDVQVIQNVQEYIYEDFFKEWLLDKSKEKESLRLVMPSRHNDEVLIKCDLQECIINPNLFPGASELSIDFKQISSSNAIRPGSHDRLLSDFTMPIYRMEVVAQVESNMVCDSLIFGTPWLVSNSMTCSLSFWEISHNEKLFLSLNSKLMAKNRCLILKYEGIKATGHFLLNPSGNVGLLRSLAPKELYLPRQITSNDEQSLLSDRFKEINCQIDDCLTTISEVSEYNPLSYLSGLSKFNIANNHPKKIRPTPQHVSNNDGNDINDHAKREINFNFNRKKKSKLAESGSLSFGFKDSKNFENLYTEI